MVVHLDPKWTKHLEASPESGMGYQLVDVTLRSGEHLSKLPVFNGEYLEVPDSVTFEASAIELIELHR